jgi:hypothetical protein
MKKVLQWGVSSVTVAAMVVAYSPALAAGYGAAGCGPGSMIFKQNTKSEQLMSWGTNFAISVLLIPSIQQSAISSGVSNCGGSKAAVLAQEDERFVAQNFESLAKEMAAGGGESLETLAGLLGCSAEQRVRFASLTRQRYAVLFSDDQTGPEEMLARLKDELSHDALMATSCGRV